MADGQCASTNPMSAEHAKETWITVQNAKRERRMQPSDPRRGIPPHQVQLNPSEDDIARLEHSLRDYRARFKKFDLRNEVVRMLEREINKREGVRIDTAVCLALGSVSQGFAPEYAIFERKSRWQFAMLLEMLEVLEKMKCNSMDNDGQEDHKIKLIIQEPQFQELDRQVMKRFGAEVTDHPAANQFITETCFLYVPFMEKMVLLKEILPGKNPLVYLGWSSLAEVEIPSAVEDKEEMVVTAKEFAKDRDEIKILTPFDPGDNSHKPLTGLSMYWKSIED